MPPPLRCLLYVIRPFLTGSPAVIHTGDAEPWRLRFDLNGFSDAPCSYAVYLSRDESIVSSATRLLDAWQHEDAQDLAARKTAVHYTVMLDKILLLSYLGANRVERSVYSQAFDLAWQRADPEALHVILDRAATVRRWRAE